MRGEKVDYNNKNDMIQFAAWIVIWLSPSTNFKQKRG